METKNTPGGINLGGWRQRLGACHAASNSLPSPDCGHVAALLNDLSAERIADASRIVSLSAQVAELAGALRGLGPVHAADNPGRVTHVVRQGGAPVTARDPSAVLSAGVTTLVTLWLLASVADAFLSGRWPL